MSTDHVPAAVHDAVAEVLGESEIAAVLALIVSIDAWNAIGVSTRTWRPGSYEL